jgi:O-antigen/teichoic acid export membrane protein
MPGHRRVSVGASIVTISQVTAALAGGLTAVVVARLLGPAGTGAYGVVLAIFAVTTVVSGLGVGTGAVYRVSSRRWSEANAIRQVQMAALALGLVGAGLGLVVARLARGSAFQGVDLGTVAIGLAALPFALSWSFGSSVSIALDRYEHAALATVSQAVGGLALIAALAPAYGVRGAVVGMSASHALTALWLAAVSIRRSSRVEGWLRQAPFEILSASRFGIKASLTNVLSVVNQRVDLIVLNAFALQTTVGHYSVALSLTALQMLLPRSIGFVVLPRVSSLAGGDASEDRALVVSKSVKHAILVAVGGAIAMACALLAVPLVFGSDFRPAVLLGWILIPGTAALGLASVLAATIVGSGRPGYLLRAAAIVTPVTLVLYVLLISQFEAVGAAVASTLSYTMTLVLVWQYFRRVTGIHGLRTLLPGLAELADYRELLGAARARVRAR